MKQVCTLLFLLAGSALYGSGLSSASSVQGNYIEARTADVYTGPCFANSEAGNVGDFAIFGWQVSQGQWNGVSLDGLSIVGVVKASATLGDVTANPYPVSSVLIVDERATALQRVALQSMAREMGGQLLQNVVRVEYQPIALEIANGNIHGGAATLTAGTLAKIQTRSLSDHDHICHNEEVWYSPLNKLDHAMPAYTLANTYSGKGLGTVWSNPYKRSAFLGTFSAVGGLPAGSVLSSN